ncbi:MAG: LEM-3-like GIY-YIG domain-containing protein [Phycisphaerales bacterium]
MNQPAEAFPPEVIEKLKTYVYRLIDPRDGETFYVGKGKGNRVFAHIHGEQGIEGDDLDNKMKRIRAIRLAGFEVAHVIHRHGMDDATAFEVESVLMDAYPGLTNEAGGVGGNEFGAMHALEIIREYAAEPAAFRHNAILISVNRSALAESSLYEATRYAWKISPTKAQKADVVLATVQGIIKGAFVADEWLEATATNFPGRQDVPGRYGFNGHDAPEDMQREYVGKSIPDEYRKRGAANPIKYAQMA